MGENMTLRWMVTVIGFIVVVATVVVFWLRSINTLPVVKIPTPVMPKPNAYDYFVGAGNAIVDDKKINDATRAPGLKGHVYTMAEKKALVSRNSQALADLREGFGYQCMNPPSRDFDTPFRNPIKWRDLARLLVLESQVKEAHGDHSGAIGSTLDAVELGAVSPKGGAMVVDLIGIMIQASGRKQAWVGVDKLNAGEARAAAKRLETIITRQMPFADVLIEEKWRTTAGLIDLLQTPDAFRVFTDPTTGTQEIWQRLRFATTNKGTVIYKYMRYMDTAAENTRKPYASNPSLPPRPTDRISQEVVPDLARARFRHVNLTDTQNSLLLVTLALRAYKVEHGQYPASLADLVPTCLKRLPDDPFALSGPLRYKQKGNGYVLYSIGPDGKDDGGKPIVDTRGPARSRYYVTSDDAKGDIVAGVNE